MTQTTSPLLASLDACRQQLATDGERLLGRAVELAADARRRLRVLPGLDVLGPDRLGLAADRFDPLKLVVDVSGLGLRENTPSGCCGTASPSPRRRRPARRRGDGDHRRHPPQRGPAR
jgi:arginine/lysine/ornithine decarboxylase